MVVDRGRPGQPQREPQLTFRQIHGVRIPSRAQWHLGGVGPSPTPTLGMDIHKKTHGARMATRRLNGGW
jgi:hypothetical protein